MQRKQPLKQINNAIVSDAHMYIHILRIEEK